MENRRYDYDSFPLVGRCFSLLCKFTLGLYVAVALFLCDAFCSLQYYADDFFFLVFVSPIILFTLEVSLLFTTLEG